MDAVQLGPGPSCTNAIPNATERSRVNQLWANGLAQALDKALSKTDARQPVTASPLPPQVRAVPCTGGPHPLFPDRSVR